MSMVCLVCLNGLSVVWKVLLSPSTGKSTAQVAVLMKHGHVTLL